MLRHQSEMKTETFVNCHEGTGELLCRWALARGDSQLGIQFMHDDVIEPGASIGEHRHDDEEVYFVVDGHGTMLLDGQSVPIGPGDVAMVQPGHTHGLLNSTDGPKRLIVICVKYARPARGVPSGDQTTNGNFLTSSVIAL